MANLGTYMLRFENMEVNMNGTKPLQNMIMDYIIHNGSFLNFIAPNSFSKINSLFFMYEVGKSPKQREWITPAAASLRRSYGVVAVSQKFKILKIRDGYFIAAIIIGILRFHNDNIVFKVQQEHFICVSSQHKRIAKL